MSNKIVRYTLVSPSGEVKSGSVGADELESILSLANQGYEILELTEEKTEPERSPKQTPSVTRSNLESDIKAEPKVGKRISSQDLKFFTLNLAELLTAGVTLLDAITSIRQSDNGPLGEIAAALAMDIQSGHSLSGALSRSKYYFDPTFVGMIRVGEESGRLPSVLSQLNLRVTRSEALKRSLIQASIYPAALVVASILLLAFVGFFVVPAILPIIQAMTDETPWPTRILLFIHAHGWKFTLSGLAVLACLPWLWSSNPTAVSIRQWLKFESPLFGSLARTQAVNQFCNDLGLLLESGVSVVKALGFIRFEDLALESAKRRIVRNIVNGESLAEAFQDEPVFPKLLSVLLLVSEESGANLASILQYQSQLLEFEAEENKRALSRLFEPILISVMGLIVGFVLMAVFLPIYSQLAANL